MFAEDGFGYAGGAGLRLRATPSKRGGVAARLELGQLVRIYDDFGDWMLVHAAPEGPAGFAWSELIEDRPPIGALAKIVAFEKCAAKRSRKSRKACLQRAEGSLEVCLEQCAGVPPQSSELPAVDRCEKACRMAFTTCADACKKKRKRRRRRRR